MDRIPDARAFGVNVRGARRDRDAMLRARPRRRDHWCRHGRHRRRPFVLGNLDLATNIAAVARATRRALIVNRFEFRDLESAGLALFDPGDYGVRRYP